MTISREWIGKLGNCVYRVQVNDVSIFTDDSTPGGLELSVEHMKNSYLDGWTLENLDKSLVELNDYIDHLLNAYDIMCTRKWEIVNSQRGNKPTKVSTKPFKTLKKKTAKSGK